MNPSKVILFDGISNLREAALECFKIISRDFGQGEVALKIHFGEDGNVTHIKPQWLKDASNIFETPVFAETNVLYRGSRTTKKDHLEVARKHGFDYIPVEIFDGEYGGDYVEVPVNLGGIEKAKLGAGIKQFSQCIAVTHFKGHLAAGFGGALKNIGMGLGSRAGKLQMHSIISPTVKSETCIGCGTCVSECPVDAISLDGKAQIDSEKCIGCAHCIAICPEKAIDIPWDMSDSVNKKLMERIVAYAKAALKDRRWWFMNFLTDVTYDCDCFGIKQESIIDDVGILLSRDPVAIDAASLDLVEKAHGGFDPFLEKHGVDGRYILEYAEKAGLGTRNYSLSLPE